MEPLIARNKFRQAHFDAGEGDEPWLLNRIDPGHSSHENRGLVNGKLLGECNLACPHRIFGTISHLRTLDYEGVL